MISRGERGSSTGSFAISSTIRSILALRAATAFGDWSRGLRGSDITPASRALCSMTCLLDRVFDGKALRRGKAPGERNGLLGQMDPGHPCNMD